MAKPAQNIRRIQVYADWIELGNPVLLGTLQAEPVRGKEIFSFSYDTNWLKSGQAFGLDPDLGFYSGPQYAREDKPNFGIFLDSSPDRWGRLLMERREALYARNEGRKANKLMETDFLLGVYDHHRMGAIRFKTSLDGVFFT